MALADVSPAFVALVQATAGAAGGVIASFALMPLEVIKTRIQVSNSERASLGGACSEILTSEGCMGFFRGVVAKCLETGVKNFVYFYIYDAINTVVKRQMKLRTSVKLVLGFLAGVGTTTLTMPLEVLATRLQVEAAEGCGMLTLLSNLLTQEGPSVLFRGYPFNIVLCVNPAIQNTCFDKMKDTILRFQAQQWKQSGKSYTCDTYPALTPLQSFSLGALAKAIATIVTFPLVRIKTILLVGGKPALDGEEKISDQGFLEMLAKFYCGIASALAKSVLQAALLYMSKDQIEQLVVKIFKVSFITMRRRSGRLKLGVTSGRPLPS